MVNWIGFVARDSVPNWPENSRKVDGKTQPYGVRVSFFGDEHPRQNRLIDTQNERMPITVDALSFPFSGDCLMRNQARLFSPLGAIFSS